MIRYIFCLEVIFEQLRIFERIKFDKRKSNIEVVCRGKLKGKSVKYKD